MHQVFERLDLSILALRDVAEAVNQKNNQAALKSLLEYYKIRENYEGFLFYKNNSPENLKQVIQEISLDEKQHIFSVCEELSQNIFLFQEPWDMERTQTPFQFSDDIDWQINPNHDPEWTFMLNRMNYLNVLAQAYLLTSDHKYTVIYMRLLREWLQKNERPHGKEVTSWRSIDSAIRLRNWIKSLEVFLLDDAFSPDLLAEVIVSCDRHLSYLKDGWNINRLQTNWVILESNGAYLGALFFQELLSAKNTMEKCLPYVTKAALTQETSEGMHWEQSYQYHHEVLLKLAEIYLLSERNGKELPIELKQVINRMSVVAAHIRKPDGKQDNYGDSDREFVDELLILLEQITGIYLLDTNQESEITRFLLGHFGKVLPKIKSSPRYFSSYAIDEAGIYIIKDQEQQLHAQFKCGFLGHGHGHDDLLHLSVFDDGEDVLIDAGRYSYEQEFHQRLSFKSAAFHNTTMVDETPINQHKNCWDASKVAHQINAKYRFSDKMDFVEGGHLGYLDLPDPVFVNRKVLYIKPEVMMIVDEFLGRGNHVFSQHLHFKLDQLEKVNDSTLSYTNSRGKQYQIRTFTSDRDTEFSWTITNQYTSDDYNEKHLTPTASMSVNSVAPFSMCTFIGLNGQDLSIEPVDVYNEYECIRKRSTASAFRLDENRYVVVNHFEDADSRRAYIVDGYQVYGRIVLLDKQQEEANVTRIY